MSVKYGCAVVGLVLLFTAGPVAAHHSFSSEYDESKLVELTGVVSKVEWLNPHARFYVDVKESNGKVTTWNFELASVNSLRRNGWTRNSLKVGAEVTAKGYAAKSGEPMANAGAVIMADGTELFAATSAPSVQQTPSAGR